MKRFWLLLAAWFTLGAGSAQDLSVKGVVMEEQAGGKLVPLEFVTVYWLKSTANTQTDSTGYFFIAKGPADGDQLVFRHLGHEPDTVTVQAGQYVSVVFKATDHILGEVVVAHRKRTTEVSFLDPLQVQSISREELFKAACCNLSESFTTNATVDVSFTDAVTGAKQIQMLGLSGKYSLISQEQMPAVRGLAIPYGMLYIPGPWIESIQITKGTGSVLQGYESMTGQINVEIKKPTDKEKLHINGFMSEAWRSELNLVTNAKVSPMFSTAVLGHVSLYPAAHDRNNDGWLDMPEGSLFTFTNRWAYRNQKTGVEGQFSANYTRDRKKSGTDEHGGDIPGGHYDVNINGDRLNLAGKLGYVFPEKRYRSIGSQWGFTYHKQDALIGHRRYLADQTSFYGNVLYQSIIGDTRHQYVTGMSFRYDDYDEAVNTEPFGLTEVVPGAFIEYTYKPDVNFSLVAGFRADHHNIYGVLLTPRLHVRYAPVQSTVLRFSGGRGFRTPLPIAENLGHMASARTWTIGQPGVPSDYPYNGLAMEKSWNVGASLTQEFVLDYRSGVVTVDFYHTRFTDRVVTDLDLDPQQLHIYNLEPGATSFANVFQVEAAYELLKRLDFKIAYKLQDSRIDYREGLRQQVFTPLSRFFANLSYVTSLASYKGSWRFNVTAHRTGQQRIPDTDTSPAEFQLPAESPAFWLFNAQITRVFNKKFDVYVGVENLGNYKQSPVILNPENPHGQYFDASMVWGPIFGREYYFGFRYVLNAE